MTTRMTLSREHSAMRSALVALAIVLAGWLAGGASLDAQANIGSQGFGYPPGQLSARAYASGGAVAEMDPWSPVNPASVGMLGTRLLFFQIEPEFRTVQSAGGTDRTTTARYPLVFGAMPVGQRWVVSVGASTLLDRSAATEFQTMQRTGADSVGVSTTFRVNGAINDLRLAAAWTPQSWLRVGVGAHALTGRNLVSVLESFSDSTAFANLNLQRNLSFSGAAVSAGAQLFTKTVLAAVSVRHGGSMHVSAGDTVISSANAPDRLGVSLAYTGIANSAIAVRTSHENWSSLGGLGSAGFRAVDAWDTSVGGELAGPRLGAHPLMLRAGARRRTLPFQAEGRQVDEKSIMGGLGTFWAAGHVLTDLAVIRASRDASLPASEKAWTISIGISIRQ